MEAIIILGTIEEQEKFLDVILYNDKDKISNVYIEAFLKSDIKKSELSDKIIEYFLKNKIKISKYTLYKIIEPIEKIKKSDDEKSKNEKLEELFNMGVINLQSIREAYKEVNEKD